MRRLLEFFYCERRITRLVPWSPKPGQVRPAYLNCFGLLWNPKALWMGAHYSSQHKRLCINLLPCLTIWWARPGGQLP